MRKFLRDLIVSVFFLIIRYIDGPFLTLLGGSTSAIARAIRYYGPWLARARIRMSAEKLK